MGLTDDDIWQLFEDSLPVFSDCKHLIFPMRCAAFERIPLPIWLGDHDHRTPYDGDQGLRFEPLPEDDAL